MLDRVMQEVQLFVEDTMDLAEIFSRAAARIAARSLAKTLKPDQEHLLRNFQVAYERSMLDAYLTGAIETMRVSRGEKSSLEWMNDQDTPTVARKHLLEERFKQICQPHQPIGEDPVCSEENCVSYDGKRCELEGFPCRQCEPWIEIFGREPPVEAPRRDSN